MTCIITEDSLSSHAPHIATLQAHGLHAILGVKAGDQASLCHQGQAAEQDGRVIEEERHERATGVLHRLRFVHDVPLKASNTDVRVHGIEYWEMGKDEVPHLSGVTALRVSMRTVYRLMRGGRARWKIDHATFNTLNNQGDNCAHNDGHGRQHLSVVFATIQTQQLCCALFQAVWAKMGSKRHGWERLRSLCSPSRRASRRA